MEKIFYRVYDKKVEEDASLSTETKKDQMIDYLLIRCLQVAEVLDQAKEPITSILQDEKLREQGFGRGRIYYITRATKKSLLMKQYLCK